MVFEKKWMEKIVEPDDKEAIVTKAEHRIKLAVQREADERWRNRMDREDRQDYNEHYRHCAPMW